MATSTIKRITAADVGAKAIQSAKSSPSASGTAVAFIDTISQDAQGEITATKKSVPGASQNVAGMMSAEDKTKLDGIAAGAQVNSVTGVKGNAESSYRNGNVNLTPENIGAVATSDVVDIAHGGTGASDEQAMHTAVFNNTRTSGWTSYPTAAGLYRTTGTLWSGLPSGASAYGVLAIMSCGGYYMHLYADTNGDLYYGEKGSAGAPSSWKKANSLLSGGTITGALTVTGSGIFIRHSASPILYLQDANGGAAGGMYSIISSHQAVLREYHTGDTNYEDYRLPTPGATGSSAAYQIITSKNPANGRSLLGAAAAEAQYYEAYGLLGKSASGTMRAHGYAHVNIRGKAVIIDFGIQVTTAGSSTSNYDVGLYLAEIRARNSNIPAFTPTGTGVIHYYKADGTLNTTMEGYCGTATAYQDTYWGFGRIHTTSGDNGWWADSNYTNGMHISGTVYGTLS